MSRSLPHCCGVAGVGVDVCFLSGWCPVYSCVNYNNNYNLKRRILSIKGLYLYYIDQTQDRGFDRSRQWCDNTNTKSRARID